MSDPEDDIVTAALKSAAAKYIPKPDPAQVAQRQGYIARAKLAAEMFAAPKMLEMKQNISQNIPGARATSEAILRAARPAATDVGDIDEPKVRQPVQMSREFPSNPAGQVDQDEYITKVRQAMKNAVAAPRKRSLDQDTRDELDEDSLGPSGEHNTDPPDYNYIKNPSPLNVSEAIGTPNGSISKETEAYMRREGMWGPRTDLLLEERGQRKKQ